MEEFIVAGFILLVSAFISASQADEATGICCNSVPQAWMYAVSGCSCKNGYLASYDPGIGKTVANLSLRSDVDIWTAEYALKLTNSDRKGQSSYQTLCGFSYINSTSLTVKKVLFGSCDVERYYICKNGAGQLVVYQNKHGEIKINCKNGVSKSDLESNRQSIIPGLYWTVNVTSITVGPGKTNESCNKSCFSRPTTATTTTTSTPINIVSTSVKQTDKTTGTITGIEQTTGSFKRTDKTTGTVKGTDKTMGSFNRTDKTMATVKGTDKTTGSFKRTDKTTGTDTPSLSSTENNTQSTGNKPVTQSTNFQNRTKTQENKLDEQKGKENDFGVEVGLPVGLCLALIFGIMFSIYLSRRYKCWKTKTNSNKNSSRNTESPGSSKSSSGRVLAHFNASYEVNEEIATQMKNHNEKNYESKYPNRNKKHHTEPNSEYAVVHRNKIAHSNKVQTVEYSFAKEIDNDGERRNIGEGDYDVTGNDLSYPSNNIYNHLQGEEYDSSTNVRIGDTCNNVYGIAQSKQSESVYDSTRQLNDSSPCDNVYNQLSQDTARNEQNCYDSTLNISKIGKVKGTDQTYGKLR